MILEIIKHDGPARLCVLHLEKKISTPNLFFPLMSNDDLRFEHDLYLASDEERKRHESKKNVVYYCKSLFGTDGVDGICGMDEVGIGGMGGMGGMDETGDTPDERFRILPDFPVGLNVPEEIASLSVGMTLKSAKRHPGMGAVIHGSKYPGLREKAANALKDRPILVIANGAKLIRNPRLTVEIVTRVRDAVSPNAALYFPSAPPETFYILSYMGIDLFDASDCIMQAGDNRIVTTRGSLYLDAIKEIPCTCGVCKDKSPGDLIGDFQGTAAHNFNTALTALKEIREAIRGGTLRNLVEEKAACSVGSMAMLRILDREKQAFLERYTPVFARGMDAITAESLNRPEVVRWIKRIKTRYSPPEDARLTVILPCSKKKPYSKSKSHFQFQKHIRRGAKGKIGLVHEVILTSPLGIVPRELEGTFPAAHYDTAVTGHWTAEEKDIAASLMKDYMKKSKTVVIAHVDGAYREICRALDIPVTSDAAHSALGHTGNVLSDESLKVLEKEVRERLKEFAPVKKDRKTEALRKLCDFQFGQGSSKYLIKEGTTLRRYQLLYDGKQIAAINPQTGCLAISIEGGRLLKEYGRHLVDVSFKPGTNSIFSVGVDGADPGIRPGDEVIVIYEDEVVGVGKAHLNGEEMVRAKKGLAIELRHRV